MRKTILGAMFGCLAISAWLSLSPTCDDKLLSKLDASAAYFFVCGLPGVNTCPPVCDSSCVPNSWLPGWCWPSTTNVDGSGGTGVYGNCFPNLYVSSCIQANVCGGWSTAGNCGGVRVNPDNTCDDAGCTVAVWNKCM